MTQDELDRKLFEAMIKVKTNLGLVMVKIGQTALVRIRQRVVEEGKDSKGGNFFPSTGYSREPMLVGAKSFRRKDADKFFGKIKNKSHKWVTIKRGEENYHLAVLEGGYRELRDISLGRGAGDKVNFSFTNAMWGDLHLVSNASEHDKGVVKLGMLRKEENDKLYYNTERNKEKGGGDILDLSEAEINELQELFGIEFLNIVKNSGL